MKLHTSYFVPNAQLLGSSSVDLGEPSHTCSLLGAQTLAFKELVYMLVHPNPPPFIARSNLTFPPW